MSTGKVLLGVLAGVAAGALMGVLFAPDKGSETRKKISRKGSDTVDDLKEKIDELLSSISEKIDSTKEGHHENGRNKASEIKKEARA